MITALKSDATGLYFLKIDRGVQSPPISANEMGAVRAFCKNDRK